VRGLDTNVLVRFLLRDDPSQAKAAEAAIAEAVDSGQPLLVSLLTMLETEWVLRSAARLNRTTIVRTFKSLLETRDLDFENEAVLEQALYDFENPAADFADCLMLAAYRAQGCSSMLTFDHKAAKLPGAELLSV
jgi:predicted nucleic-acid-binding protein